MRCVFFPRVSKFYRREVNSRTQTQEKQIESTHRCRFTRRYFTVAGQLRTTE